MLKRIVSAIIAITMILAMFTFTAHARTYTRVANVSNMANLVIFLKGFLNENFLCFTIERLFYCISNWLFNRHILWNY